VANNDIPLARGRPTPKTLRIQKMYLAVCSLQAIHFQNFYLGSLDYTILQEYHETTTKHSVTDFQIRESDNEWLNIEV